MKRPGLTLLETLAAAAMLTLITIAAVPLMRDIANLLLTLDRSGGSNNQYLFSYHCYALGQAISVLSPHEIANLHPGLHTIDPLGATQMLISRTQSESWYLCTWQGASVLLFNPDFKSSPETLQ